jgi:hypothetical protein
MYSEKTLSTTKAELNIPKVSLAYLSLPVSIKEVGLYGITLNIRKIDCVITVNEVNENMNLQKNYLFTFVTSKIKPSA